MNEEEEKRDHLGKAKELLKHYKQQEQEANDEEEDIMIQNLIKNAKTCEEGGNQATITFDERLLNDKVYNEVSKQREQAMKTQDHQAMQNLMIQDDFQYLE